MNCILNRLHHACAAESDSQMKLATLSRQSRLKLAQRLQLQNNIDIKRYVQARVVQLRTSFAMLPAATDRIIIVPIKMSLI